MNSPNRSRPDRPPCAGSELPRREVMRHLPLPAVEDLVSPNRDRMFRHDQRAMMYAPLLADPAPDELSE
jgi:hypothetical protein